MRPALDGYLNDDKDETKGKDQKKETTSSRSSVSVSGSAKKSDNLSYIKQHEDDSLVWQGPGQVGDERRNPLECCS